MWVIADAQTDKEHAGGDNLKEIRKHVEEEIKEEEKAAARRASTASQQRPTSL
jgi:hypothetical protein